MGEFFIYSLLTQLYKYKYKQRGYFDDNKFRRPTTSSGL